MWFYHPQYLREAEKLCREHGILIIFDEIATGFGRTGKLFAWEHAGVEPDIMCIGKALTGGYMTLSAVLTTNEVADKISNHAPGAFMHGPTFMGNALACSVALKSIEIFESQDYMAKIRRIEEITRREMEGFSDPRIKEIRIMGACVCIEVYDSNTIKEYQQFAYKRGVFSRPFLNYLYAMVPYVIEEDELVKVLQTMKEWFSEKC